MEKDTVSMHFVHAAVARLSPEARHRALGAAGIPPDLLAAPQARVPAEAFSALWLSVARELDDEFFGLDRRRMKVGSFALLCQAVLHHENLDRALKLLLRGLSTFLDDVHGELGLEDQQAVLSVVNRIADPAARRFADETFLILVHGLMCWLTGQRIALTEAAFAHDRPAHAAEYTLMYAEQLVFDAPVTQVRFDARLLNAPIVQNAASLRTFLRTAPQSIFLKYRNEDSWTARLRRRLRDCLGQDSDWPTLPALAQEFSLTPTTLRRRLEAEGTHYQDLKDQLRRAAAIDLLCHGTLSIADIGARLGFQEPSAFHRAFKRWAGVQPGEYRQQQGLAAAR